MDLATTKATTGPDMTSGKARVELPQKLLEVFSGEADVRGAYGGRGSGKTRSFALMTAVRALMWAQAGREGIVLCGREFMNSLDESSMEEVKAAINSTPWLRPHFEIGAKYIRTADGRVHYRFAGLNRNIDSIKSKARILLCWVDEAETVSETAWRTLIPTIREEDSELWVTWNPRRSTSATHKRFRAATDPRMKVVEINWRDNPKFPQILNRVRLRDLEISPESYDHVWEGGFAQSAVGSYYSKHLAQARLEGRIGRVAPDPLLRKRAFVDIGGTGARADAFALWVCQFVGREIRVLDYYEAVGQPLAAHLVWLTGRKHAPDTTDIWLPHDGVTHDRVYQVTYQSALEDAGYSVSIVKNQGPGAAMARIQAARRVLPSCWIHAESTKGGLEALAWYHEKRDDNRELGLGPEHDWSSHAADAFGMMAVVAVDELFGSFDQAQDAAAGRRSAARSGRRRWGSGSAMAA
jgi:phage terminase large subunit